MYSYILYLSRLYLNWRQSSQRPDERQDMQVSPYGGGGEGGGEWVGGIETVACMRVYVHNGMMRAADATATQ